MTDVAIIGDSQAGGLELPLRRELSGKGWQVLYTAHLNGGSTRRIIDDGLVVRALAARPGLLVVAAGGNDTSSSSASWGELLGLARRVGVDVLWVGPPAAAPGQEVLDARRADISVAQQRFFATKTGVRWVSGRETAAGLPRADEVHLTPAGYASWAGRLAGAIAGSGGMAAIGLAVVVLWGAWTIANRTAGSRGRRGRSMALSMASTPTVHDLLRLHRESLIAARAEQAALTAREVSIRTQDPRRMTSAKVRNAQAAADAAATRAIAAREAFRAAKRAAPPEVVAELNRMFEDAEDR